MKEEKDSDNIGNTTASLFDIKPVKRHSNKAFNVLQDLFGDEVGFGDDAPLSRKRKSILLLLLLIGGLLGLHRLYLGFFFTCFAHISGLAFCILSFLILPDQGMGILMVIIIYLWTVADFLAIIFSPIKDSQGKLVSKW